jgi:hypothetical protein
VIDFNKSPKAEFCLNQKFFWLWIDNLKKLM